LADDLVQESYLRLLSANAPWEAGEEACRRYLFRIGTNLMRDHRRRPSAASLQDVPEPLLPSVNPISMESMDSNIQLHKAMMQLRPVERQLLWLAHAEDLSYREISDITGLSVARIRLTLFRSRHKLARAVRQELVKAEVRS
jgi:RNA polymerase sigma-70 factor (ECF subfamily)